jgi:hypothetical protein
MTDHPRPDDEHGDDEEWIEPMPPIQVTRLCMWLAAHEIARPEHEADASDAIASFGVASVRYALTNGLAVLGPAGSSRLVLAEAGRYANVLRVKLDELADECTCGHDRGDHMVEAPHECDASACGCRGFVALAPAPAGPPVLRMLRGGGGP